MTDNAARDVIAERLRVAIRLRHAITTLSNDDYSEAGTRERSRHVERITSMMEAADVFDEMLADLSRTLKEQPDAEAK